MYLTKDIYEKLEFDKVLALVSRECFGEPARAYFETLTPMTDAALIERKLKEVKELRLTLEKNDRFPMSAYEDLTEDLKLLAVDGFVLQEEALIRVMRLMGLMREVYRFFNAIRREVYPNLYACIREVSWDDTLLTMMMRVLDDQGNVRADASAELQKIRNSITQRRRDCDSLFRTIINKYRNSGWLTDNVETFRNGRRVLSVPSEHKRKVRGIIHDESTTGRTAYIEPEEVIAVNNDIFDLEVEERREIYKILKNLCASLRPYGPQIAEYQNIAIYFDIVYAKARLAKSMRAEMPNVVDRPYTGVLKAYHPLLYLKNKAAGKKTIPFDMVFFQDQRILMLSGPNAGGKSVVMKAVGLLHLMMQCGMLIPVSILSEMGVYHKFFADIGDQQSLEDDLSTYSSHLQNMREFVKEADEKSLILIDEFGSGTDPKIGGAIAEAILRELNERKIHGVVTTHYSNLKIYAFKTEGLINGSMYFDREKLTPTYELKVGRPGSSYAFEIAEKNGLGKRILGYVRHRIGANEKAVDELLIDLQREKKEVEEHLASLKAREEQLDKLVKSYDDLRRDLEQGRKKLKLDQKEFALMQTQNETRALEKLIKDLRTEGNAEKIRQKIEEKKQERTELGAQADVIREEISKADITVIKKAFAVGDHIKFRSGGAKGIIETVDKSHVNVVVGEMRMRVHQRDLEIIEAPKVSQRVTNHNLVEKSATFEPNIDLRGMLPTDALQRLENFLDEALLTSANSLRIVHGKGNGVLRNLVRNKLKEYRSQVTHHHPEHYEGGDGVTIVEVVN